MFGRYIRARCGQLRKTGIIVVMTLLEITYELQSPLSMAQLSRLGEFANTYGLRKFRVDEPRNRLTFEYDASRLRRHAGRSCAWAGRHRRHAQDKLKFSALTTNSRQQKLA